jgi:Flp pilus assembly pilin Flp
MFKTRHFEMHTLLKRAWAEQDGVLTFEWTLLITLVTIGVVGGISAARDAIIDELGDTAQVMVAVDQSYRIGFPLAASVHVAATSSASDSDNIDAAFFDDCDRPLGLLPPEVLGQGTSDDNPE